MVPLLAIFDVGQKLNDALVLLLSGCALTFDSRVLATALLPLMI
jgi:hypothetical protein